MSTSPSARAPGLVLELRLLSGRFHATPWGHHANEGQVEWPPSPWRIARALAAVALRQPPGPSKALKALLCALGSTPPVFELPKLQPAHTRHYVPLGPKKDGVDHTTKILDGFLAGDRRHLPTVRVHWPALCPSADELAELDTLCRDLSYLGRAESWVEAGAILGTLESPTAVPTAAADPGPHTTPTPVALLRSQAAFDAWREGYIAAGGKRAGAPTDRWDALTVDTHALHRGRWSAAPGMCSVPYSVSEDPVPPRQRSAHRPASPPTLALYTIQDRVLPGVGQSLSMAEHVRRALLSLSDGAPVFVGRQADGTPMRGHRHAHVLPMARARAGRHIDTLAVFAPAGFDAQSQHALQRMTRLRRRDGRGAKGDGGELRLVLVALAHPEDFGAVNPAPGALALPQLGLAARWRSTTPFLCPRHPKRRADGWRDTAEEQLAAAWAGWLALRCPGPSQPTVVEVRRVHESPQDERLWARQFQRERRSGGGSQGSRRGHAFEVTLSTAVQGPVSLGYGAHFGLGQFAAVD